MGKYYIKPATKNFHEVSIDFICNSVTISSEDANSNYESLSKEGDDYTTRNDIWSE